MVQEISNLDRRTLIGSISRSQLQKVVENHMGVKARQAEARRRIQNAIQRVDERLKMGEMTLKDLFQEESSTEVNKKEEGPVVEQKTVSKKK